LPVAEVFLSGLLQRLPGQEGIEPDMAQYDFVLKVRDVLRQTLPEVDIIEVINSVSAAVEKRWNQFSNQDFRAFLTNPNVEAPEGLGGLRSFANLTADILEPLGRDYASFARQLRRGAEPRIPPEPPLVEDDFPLQVLEYEVAKLIDFPPLEILNFTTAQLVESSHREDTDRSWPPSLQTEEYTVATITLETHPQPNSITQIDSNSSNTSIQTPSSSPSSLDINSNFPPPNFPLRHPQYHTLESGSYIMRIFKQGRSGPLIFRHFGPIARFDHHRIQLGDSPTSDSERGIYYAALTFSSCLMETFSPMRSIEIQEDLFICRVQLNKDLTLLDLRLNGDLAAGSTEKITNTSNLKLSQAWSRYFYENTNIYGNIDGIFYPSEHDQSGIIALYERASELVFYEDQIWSLNDPLLRQEILQFANENNLIIVP
jgi:RES domain